MDRSTITTDTGQDDESVSVLTQDTGVYENDDDDLEGCVEGEMVCHWIGT